MVLTSRTKVLYSVSMLVQSPPDTLTKIAQMGDATIYEPAGDQPQQERRRAPYQSRSLDECITNVSTPQGKKPILKTMLTTACERNCFYCPFRAGRSKTKRVTFTPDEIAGALDTLTHTNRVQGLFLSSGIIKGSVTTQDKIIDTVEIVRNRYAYRGYVHLKIMPGVQYEQLYRAMQLADRISVNLEAPTQERLSALAPKKDFTAELLKMLRWAEVIRRDNPQEKLARTVTQFVVGAVGDTDQELLSLSERLYRHAGLTRAYYSGFSPVQDLAFLQDGNLQIDIDPKRAWAERYLREAPIEIMTANRAELLRVPGIGPVGADAILQARRLGRITDLSHLRKLHIHAPEQAAPYILLDGRQVPAQLALL